MKSRRLVVAALGLLLSSWTLAAQLYWSDASEHAIKQANLDGTNAAVAFSTPPWPQGIALDGSGRIYWADVNAIRRANLDGSGVETLVSPAGAQSIALDVAGGKMYWTDLYFDGRAHRANLDGSAMESLSPVIDPSGIALDTAAGKVYWTVYAFGWIQRANLDGTNVQTLVTGLASVRDVALDTHAGVMYWADALTHKIQRANLDGTAVTDLVTGLVNPDGVALDLGNGRIYWTDFGAHAVQRAALDGSGVETIATSSLPVGIALDLPPPPPPVIEVTIDVKPGDPIGAIKLGGQGLTPVAILGSATFDAVTVDPASVTFAGAAARACAIGDVNGDGRADLVCHFTTAGLALSAGQASADLYGKTSGGKAIHGSDAVKVVP
jgi:sugar lactone lactonase YvrE